MKYFDLNKQEKELLKEFELGKLKSIKGEKQAKGRYRGYANQALKKTKNINIRVTEQVFYKFKSLAAREGMPYQTLISSLLHKFTLSSI